MANEKHAHDFGLFADAEVEEVRSTVTIGVNGNTTSVVPAVGYDWIDWFVLLDDGTAAITKVTFTPLALAMTWHPTIPQQSTIPYEPSVAGSGTTVVYPYRWEFAVTAATGYEQVFRTPVLGPSMQLFFQTDADEIDITVWAFRRKDGGPKAR